MFDATAHDSTVCFRQNSHVMTPAKVGQSMNVFVTNILKPQVN